MAMYSLKIGSKRKVAKAKGVDVRAHFKKVFETARVLKGMRLLQARKFLKNVLNHKQCVPVRRFNKGVGRTAQAKQFNHTQGSWPTKACKILLNLLRNLINIAKAKSLNIKRMRIIYVSVNRARVGRRRTFKAHGRISPFMSSPCHINIIAKEKKKSRDGKFKRVKRTRLTLHGLKKLNLSCRRINKRVKSKMLYTGKTGCSGNKKLGRVVYFPLYKKLKKKKSMAIKTEKSSKKDNKKKAPTAKSAVKEATAPIANEASAANNNVQ